MTKYIRKPIQIEATQWFKDGDHEQVRKCEPFKIGTLCGYCNGPDTTHGWIDTLEGGHIVCPGDFIVTGTAGEHWPVKPKIFLENNNLAD